MMANKKFRPGMSCDKSGRYTCYNAQGKKLNADVDVEKGKRFPPSEEDGCYYEQN